MDGTQVVAEHPHGGIEPLEGGEEIDEDEVPRMTQADMSPFMGEDRSIMGLVVAAVHHDIVHPAEGCQCCVTGHADRGAVILRMLFTMLYQAGDSEHRPEGVSKRGYHTYYI